MRLFKILIVVLLIAGCKKKEPPSPPEAALLVFPNKSSECTTGRDVNPSTREVEFQWRKAMNTETYELRVSNINTNTTQTISTRATSAKLPLEKGAPFSWVVISKNAQTTQSVSSATWLFYNAGFETAHAPFPAEIIAPPSGSSLFKDINNEVTLQWSGVDIDNDIEGYEIRFGTESPPTTVLANHNAGTMSQKVTVVANTVYYWKVLTTDKEGNTSDSGVFDFRVY